MIRASRDFAIVQTTSGDVRGYSRNDIYTYKGIPYGKAKRFMAPSPPEPWVGTRFMGYYGPTCPLDFEPVAARGNGIGMFALKNDWGYPHEDCQTLNIWTPGLGETERRPVLLWIHGGGYDYGSSHELPFYDGENLASHGEVVVVSVNHRLNIVGFLDLSFAGDRYAASPNVGLVDLVASLQWLQQNVARFGGDPDNITLFGQSGGGGKITALLNSPVARGLFHKAVIQSGSFGSRFQPRELARSVATRVLENLDIPVDRVDAIQEVPYGQLLAAGKLALATVRDESDFSGAGPVGWGPVEDDTFLPFGRFSPESLALIRDVPLMIGTTKTEFSLMAAGRTGEDMDATMVAIRERHGDRADDYVDAVKAAYPDTVQPSDFLCIDAMFREGALRDAQTIVAAGHEATFMYLFEWESPVDDGALKSMHCMELPFVFDNINLAEEFTGGGDDAHRLARQVSAAWVNFARSGAPHSPDWPDWPGYSIEGGATMIINSRSRVGHHHDRELLRLLSEAT